MGALASSTHLPPMGPHLALSDPARYDGVAGGVSLHLNWRQPPSTTRALLDDLACKILIASAPYRQTAHEMRGGPPTEPAAASHGRPSTMRAAASAGSWLSAGPWLSDGPLFAPRPARHGARHQDRSDRVRVLRCARPPLPAASRRRGGGDCHGLPLSTAEYSTDYH